MLANTGSCGSLPSTVPRSPWGARFICSTPASIPPTPGMNTVARIVRVAPGAERGLLRPGGRSPKRYVRPTSQVVVLGYRRQTFTLYPASLPLQAKKTIMQIWRHHNENIGKIDKPPGDQTKTKRRPAKTKPEEDGPKELVVLECQSPPKAAFLQWMKEFEFTVL